MIAKMLTAGGIFMGVNKHSTIHEDVHLANLIETENTDMLKDFISKRNENHQIWGFKRPLIISKANIFENEVRNPRYIIVFRDPLAVSMRNMKSMKYPFKLALDTYFSQMELVREFIRKNRYPILLISYEKALLDKRFTASQLAYFCRIAPDKITQMVDYVIPNEEGYLESTRPKME